MPGPVLAAVDPAALDLGPARLGARLAGHLGVPLTIAAVYASDEVVERLTGGQLGEDLPADADDALERALEEVRGLEPETDSVALGATSAPRALALAALEMGAGLVVVGSASRAPAGRVALGSTGQRLLDGAPCAVAVAPRDWARDAPPETVGAGFVATVEGRTAVQAAYEFAARAGARLRILAAVQPRSWMGNDDGRLVAELRSGAEQAGQDDIAALLGTAVDVDVEVREPADLLLDVSAELDLLVCGSRGYGPTPATLLGGVTRRLTDGARCAVVVTARGADEDPLSAPRRAPG